MGYFDEASFEQGGTYLAAQLWFSTNAIDPRMRMGVIEILQATGRLSHKLVTANLFPYAAANPVIHADPMGKKFVRLPKATAMYSMQCVMRVGATAGMDTGLWRCTCWDCCDKYDMKMTTTPCSISDSGEGRADAHTKCTNACPSQCVPCE